MPIFFDEDVVSAYSRADALADGMLIDVSEAAAEIGFKVPVAMTRAVWAGWVEWADEDSKRQVYQDEAGRLWDVLHMCFQMALYVKHQSTDTFHFPIYRVPRGGRGKQPKLTRLKAVIGPDDLGKPVITILETRES